jgi:hypothetical protein
MNPRTYRSSVRWGHLALSTILGTYLYSPWSSNPVFEGLVKWGIFPLVGLTGTALWQQARIMRWLGKRSPGIAASADAKP